MQWGGGGWSSLVRPAVSGRAPGHVPHGPLAKGSGSRRPLAATRGQLVSLGGGGGGALPGGAVQCRGLLELYSPKITQKILPKKYYRKKFHKMKVVLLIGPLFRCRPLFVASIASGVVSRILTARKYLSCAEYVCAGCWLDHSTAVCPAL